MTLLEIINGVLYEENLPVNPYTKKRKKGILLLDVDDTLLKAKDIYIWRKRPEDKVEVKLTPDEYAKEKVLPGEKKYYSYREFRDPEKVRNSIIKGIPYVNNLKIMDKFISGGYKIGVLTARGLEQTVYEALSEFLKFRSPDGKLRPYVLERKYVFAVNDDDKVYVGRTDYEKKRNVINKIRKYFHYVYFLDDDIKNIKEVLDLKKELPPKQAKKIRTIKAEIPKEGLNEEFLTEMAVSDLQDEEFNNLLKKNKLQEAGYRYIDLVVQNTPKIKGVNRYSGKSWLEIAHAVSGQGLARSINTALKKGLIEQDFANKVRKAVDLAVKNPPQEALEKYRDNKAEEEKIRDEFRQGVKEKEEEKITGGESPERDSFVVKVRKEIKRIDTSLIPYLEKFLSSEYTSLKHWTIEDLKDNLNWINKIVLPSFIKEPEITKERETKYRELGGGTPVKERALKTIWKLEEYKKELEEVTGTVEYINKFAGLKTKEEKIEELKSNVGFEALFKKINAHFSNISPANFSKKLKFEEDLIGKSSSRDSIGVESEKLVNKYVNTLKKVEEAYDGGNLLPFVSKNLEDLKKLILDSSFAVRTKNAKGYTPPEGFDPEREISEDEKYDEDIPEIYRGRGLGAKVMSLVKERQSKNFEYSGTTRDYKELKYLENFVEARKGNEEKVFRVFVSMYLDLIDGIGIVIASKNKGESEVELKKIKQIEKNKRLQKREEQLRNIKIEHYGSREVRDLLLIRLQKMSKDIRAKVKPIFTSIDFDELSESQLKEYISLAKNFALNDDAFIKQFMAMSSKSVQITKETAKEIIDKELEGFSPEDKFKHRIAISINYNGDKFTDEQLIELAKSALEDKSGESFKRKLEEKEFSTRIQD